MEQEGEGQSRKSGRRWIVAISLGLVTAGMVWLFAGLGDFVVPTAPRAVLIADVSSERLLALGSVVGSASEHETHAWLGVPFARPPVAERRWRAPEPPDAWADTLDALELAAPCFQVASPIGGVPADDDEGFAGSEDCLYLNIWAPRREPDGVPTGSDRWPVMVWIHGGGNVLGYSGSPLYDGARLAGREQVVMVSIAYRLGPLGWFSHPALRAGAESVLEASGNFGILDQIRALEWVQSHIAEFGGDPDNVTIFGESAGGTNVFALLLAEASRGLFHRAISQSGGTDSVSRTEAENTLDGDPPGRRQSSSEATAALLEAAGVVPGREAARDYAAVLEFSDLAEFLRSRPPSEILSVYRDPDDPSRLEVPQPIRDGRLLPTGDWLEAFRAGRFHQVPILAGANRDEMKLYFSQDESIVRKQFGLVYRIRDPEEYERRARHHSDFWAVRGVTAPATAIADSGHAAIYAYRFDWDDLPTVLGQDMSELLGAAHGFELPVLFGTWDLGDPLLSQLLYPEEGRLEREALSGHMMSYWAEFARQGRPGRGGRGELPEWLPWRAGDDRSGLWMVLDSADDGGLRMARTQLSRQSVIAAVDAEPALERAQKCALYHDLFPDRERWDSEELGRMGRDGCAGWSPVPSGR